MTNILTNKSFEQEPHENPDDFTVSPYDARAKLLSLGYTPDKWDAMMRDTVGSHFTRALVTIAYGDQPRDINEVFHELYPTTEKAHMTEGDRLADRHSSIADAEGGWEGFVGPQP